MMNIRDYRISASTVRFRRWSRTGYTVFNSLAVNVTIGKVCKSICEMALLKSNGMTNQQALCVLYAGEEPDDDADLPVLSAHQSQAEQMLFVFSMNNQAPVAAAPYYKFILLTKRLGQDELIPTAFFM